MNRELPPNLKMVQTVTPAHVHCVINCSVPGAALRVLFSTMLVAGGGGGALLLLPNSLDHGPQLSHWASNCGSATWHLNHLGQVKYFVFRFLICK